MRIRAFITNNTALRRAGPAGYLIAALILLVLLPLLLIGLVLAMLFGIGAMVLGAAVSLIRKLGIARPSIEPGRRNVRVIQITQTTDSSASSPPQA